MTTEATSFLTPDEVVQLLADRPAVHLIDVRTPSEFSDQRIEGSDNIPLDSVQHRLGDLRRGAAPAVIVCRSGARASVAARQLRTAGMMDVYVLDGGVLAWDAAGLPTISDR